MQGTSAARRRRAARRALTRDLVDIWDVGVATAYLSSPFAKRITGGTIYIDGGYNIVA